MIRNDIGLSRLFLALKASKKFIKAKINIDPSDLISIISFGNRVNKICQFTNDEEILVESLDNVKISGKGNLNDALVYGMQMLSTEMRKIGGKVHRIFILTDNKLNKDEEKLLNLANIAKGLNIYVDACQIGKTVNYSKSILKRISQFTGGDYGFFNNPEATINSGKSFASKKTIIKSNGYISFEKKEKAAPLLSKIALPLRRPNFMEIRLMMRNGNTEQKKCAICHSAKAPLTGADFFSEGRYCPSCDRPIHLSCAAMWAKKSSPEKRNIFRCPFCYFLVKIPLSAVSLVSKKKDNSKNKIEILETINTTKMKRIPAEEINKINASCSYCHNIFVGEYQVFKCENCGSYYHEPCLQKVFKEIGACRYCGYKITSK
ncbi:MAG: VWA domain-containing protein [Candidatus Lokiarchaeota archaeon]|nr:VWA domain-containing protein [Candidatus Lokiarchaeota archaeon]